MAQLGSAPALGAGCRRFKSCRPDHVMSRDICPHMSRDFLGFWGGCFGSFVRFGFGVFQDICPFFWLVGFVGVYGVFGDDFSGVFVDDYGVWSVY